MSDAKADAGLAALRDSQRRYQAIFEHAVELIAVLEAVRSADGEIIDWRYQDANANALRLLGFDLPQLRGRLLTEVLPAIAPRLIGVGRQVLQTGEPYRYESKLAGRAFLVSFFPMGPDTVGTSSLDITARSRAEEQARRLSDTNRAEKEWLSAVLGSMTEEVYFTDRQRRYTYANPAALQEFGHDSVAGIEVDQVVRRLQVLRPDGSPRPIEEAPPLRALTGEVIRDEEQIVRIPRTHEWRYRQVSAAPVRDVAGQIIGSVSVVRDVTDERRALTQLRERAARSAALLKLGDEFQAAPDPAGLVTAAARCLVEALDASRGEYCSIDGSGETLALAASCGGDESQQPRGQSALQACTDVSELLQHAHTVVCTDVTADPRMAASAATLLDLGVAAFVAVAIVAEARLTGVLWVTQGRARRWSEDEVAFVHEVAERTRLAVEHRRSEQALRVHEQQLRAADQRKDEFLAVLAHELRNPLVPIRTGVELLKDAHLRPELIDAVRPMMQRQVHHMVRLIDDLLDVSRITSGKIQLHRQPVTLGSVIESAIESNRSAIATGKLTLSVNLDQPQLLLSVDPTRFTQVIANLLQNAAKFTAPGGRIDIGSAVLVTTDRVPPQRTLTVTVTDTGTGIAAEFLPRVFDLFAQAQTAEMQPGLGIGLTLARRLVELHGGSIEAHSDGLGRGSRFSVHLPLPAQAQPQSAAPGAAAAPLPQIRVLVIDDNQDAADVMALLIGQLGAHARVAYDGASGIEAVRAFGPQVVLLDLGMPGLNGYETCRRLRAQYGAGIAIAALSGWGQQHDKIQAAQAGFDAHLTKPATPDELRELLRSLGRGKRVQ
jgi:signal transduction histidine kinase/PAS domain-containing protein/ActR/RegA family two-component response regulator